MGIFGDLFSSETKPEPGTTVLSKQEVTNNLLGLNRETCPYIVRASEDSNFDLVAEWKIVDAKWYQIFAKAGLKKVFQVWLKLDETTNTVSTTDKEYQINWVAGVPNLSLSTEAFVGKKTEFSFGAAIGFTEEFKPGVIYNYTFSTKEIKEPLKQTVLSSGWSYK
ncbi:MAG: hypothetical protein ACMG57_00715 [Candidatus Dojkabacteria bacterium]